MTEQDLIARYRLEKQLLDLQARVEELQEQLPQCKYHLRQSQAAVAEYEGFGLRSLRDKLRGDWERNRENLIRQERNAKEQLEKSKRELESAEAKRDYVLTQLEPMRQWGDTLEAAEVLEPARRDLVIRLEARLCAEKLIPNLTENIQTLELAQEWARPHNRPEAVAGLTLGTLLAQADTLARENMALQERLAACGFVTEIHPYFTNPAGYIGGVTLYNQLDRINSALDALREAVKGARGILDQIPEPQEETL